MSLQATVMYEFEEPILLVPSGDWHVGSAFCRLEDLKKDIELFVSKPYIYLVLLGDYVDNYTRAGPGGGIFEQNIKPLKAFEIVKELVEKVEDKLLGLIDGCHDLWTFQRTGQDLGEWLSEKKWLGLSGVIHVKIKSREYKVLAAHKFPYYSSFNPLNGLKKVGADYGADIVLGAHRHTPAVEIYSKRDGSPMVCVRCSAYKTTDRFIARLNFRGAPPNNPCVFLTEDGAHPFWDVRSAIKFIEGGKNAETSQV